MDPPKAQGLTSAENAPRPGYRRPTPDTVDSYICILVYGDFNFNFALGFRLQIRTLLDDVLEGWFSATPFGISSWFLEGWFSATLVRSGAKPRSNVGL